MDSNLIDRLTHGDQDTREEALNNAYSEIEEASTREAFRSLDSFYQKWDLQGGDSLEVVSALQWITEQHPDIDFPAELIWELKDELRRVHELSDDERADMVGREIVKIFWNLSRNRGTKMIEDMAGYIQVYLYTDNDEDRGGAEDYVRAAEKLLSRSRVDHLPEPTSREQAPITEFV